MAIEVTQTKKKLSDMSKLSNFITNPCLDKPSMAYQLCVKADALRLANLHREAVSRYLNAILIDRDNADSYYGLGICYKQLNNLEKAIEALEKARKLRELDYQIYYELGICYLISGEPCLAVQNLVKSLKLNHKKIKAQKYSARRNGKPHQCHRVFSIDIRDLPRLIYARTSSH